MKLQIRRGTFETNSSSMHSLAIFRKDEWELWQDGKSYLSPYRGKLFTIEELKKQYDEYCKTHSNHKEFNEWASFYIGGYTVDSIEEFYEDGGEMDYQAVADTGYVAVSCYKEDH